MRLAVVLALTFASSTEAFVAPALRRGGLVTRPTSSNTVRGERKNKAVAASLSSLPPPPSSHSSGRAALHLHPQFIVYGAGNKRKTGKKQKNKHAKGGGMKPGEVTARKEAAQEEAAAAAVSVGLDRTCCRLLTYTTQSTRTRARARAHPHTHHRQHGYQHHMHTHTPLVSRDNIMT